MTVTVTEPKVRKPWYVEGYTRGQQASAERGAAKAGCEIICANNRTLLLDLDNPEAVDKLDELIDKVNLMLPNLGVNKAYFLWKSWSGNYHAKVTLAKEVPIVERLLLEVFLGSDPIRAGYGLARYHEKKDPLQISKLFRPPGAEVELKNADKILDTGTF